MFSHPVLSDLARHVTIKTNASLPSFVPVGATAVQLLPIQLDFLEHNSPRCKFLQSYTMKLASCSDSAGTTAIVTALLERFDVLRLRVDGRGLAARIEAFGDVDVGSHIVSGSAMGDSISMVDGPSFVVNAVGDVLNFAAHHLVIDAVSWRLIDAVVRAVTTSAPMPSTSSFAAWSETISALALDRTFLSAQVDFWHKMTAPRCDLETFRHDSLVETLTHIDSFTAVASHALAALNLKPNELLLGIVLWTLSQSTNESHVAVGMEGHGRPQEIDGAESVVGWLTSVFPVASRRFDANEMEAALIHAKTVLRKVPHGGIGLASSAT